MIPFLAFPEGLGGLLRFGDILHHAEAGNQDTIVIENALQIFAHITDLASFEHDSILEHLRLTGLQVAGRIFLLIILEVVRVDQAIEVTLHGKFFAEGFRIGPEYMRHFIGIETGLAVDFVPFPDTEFQHLGKFTAAVVAEFDLITRLFELRT